ncbi:MAG: hypothetical protein WA418_31090 [Bradyrhizobium sp.]
MSFDVRTNDVFADVKLQGSDTSTLVSRTMRESALSRMAANKPSARKPAYKREDHRAGRAGRSRLNLWYLPPAFF